MVALGIALVSAMVYGASDFVGGLRARSANVIWVTVVTQIVTAIGVIAWALIFRPGTPTLSTVVWGALGGVTAVGGMFTLYRGLARGAMHVVGPVSAVCGAVVPLAFGVVTGERPGALAWAGIAAALPAVWLVAAGGASEEPDVAAGPGVPSGPGGEAGRRRVQVGAGAVDGLIAGLCFSVFYIALARSPESAGGWTMVVLELVAVVLMLAVAAIKRPPGGVRSALNAWPAGALAVAGTVTYFLATQAGMLSVVIVVISLYPAFTVLLAVLFLGERPTRTQLIGLALGAASVVLIALGH